MINIKTRLTPEQLAKSLYDNPMQQKVAADVLRLVQNAMATAQEDALDDSNPRDHFMLTVDSTPMARSFADILAFEISARRFRDRNEKDDSAITQTILEVSCEYNLRHVGGVKVTEEELRRLAGIIEQTISDDVIYDSEEGRALRAAWVALPEIFGYQVMVDLTAANQTAPRPGAYV